MGKKCFDARLIDAPPALRADQYICQFEMPEGRHRRRKFFSVKVAGDFPEGGRVCGFRFFGLGEGEVGFASFPGFGDFGEDARDESQQ